jgi:hypothetical protein
VPSTIVSSISSGRSSLSVALEAVAPWMTWLKEPGGES